MAPTSKIGINSSIEGIDLCRINTAGRTQIGYFVVVETKFNHMKLIPTTGTTNTIDTGIRRLRTSHNDGKDGIDRVISG